MSSPSQRAGGYGAGSSYAPPAPSPTPTDPPPATADEKWRVDPNFSATRYGTEGAALYNEVKRLNLHAEGDLGAFGAIGNGASRIPGGVADTYAINFKSRDPYWLEGALQIIEPYIRYFKDETKFDPRQYRKYLFSYDAVRKRVTTPGTRLAAAYANASQQSWWRGDQGLDTILAQARANLGYRTLAQSQGRRGFLKFIYWRVPAPNLETAELNGTSFEHGLDVGQTLSWFARIVLLATYNQDFQRGPGKLSTAEIARVGYDVILDTFEAFEYRGYRFFPEYGVYRFGSSVLHGFVNVVSFYADADRLWRYHNGGQGHEKISSGAKSLEKWLVECMYKVPAPNGGQCVVYPHQHPRVQSVFGGGRFNPYTGPHLIRYTAELEPDIIKLHDGEGSLIDGAMMAALANNQSQIWFSGVTQKNGKPYAKTALCVDGGGSTAGGRFQNGQLLPDTPLKTSAQIIASDSPDSQQVAYFRKRSGGLFVAYDATPNQANVARFEEIAAAFPGNEIEMERRKILCQLYRVIKEG